MRALVHDPDAAHGLRLGEAPEPRPGAGQVAGAGRGDLAELRRGRRSWPTTPGPAMSRAGTPPARSIAPAADGSGPPGGTRVVTFGWAGGWGELRAVDTDQLAVLPGRPGPRRRGRAARGGA